MLHLAQVKKNATSSQLELQLLAKQLSEHIWEVSDSEIFLCQEVELFNEGLLVLVEINDNREILAVTEAKDWVINLIKDFLTYQPITSEFVQAEQAKIEQWRQEITVKSLDLTRKQLELEAQREQLQELEATLKQDQENLEIRWQEIQALEAKYNSKNRDVDSM